MTAIGFVMFWVGFFITIGSNGSYSSSAKAAQNLGGLLIILGAVSVLAGIAIKLWELMP